MRIHRMAQKGSKEYARKGRGKDIALFDAFQKIFQNGLGTGQSSHTRNLGHYKFI